MADLKQLENALIKADAAGDAEGARILAAEIRKVRSPASSKLPGILDYSPVSGVVEGALSLGSGAAAGTAAGFAGMGQAATNALGLTETPAGDRVRGVSEALTYVPRTKAGQVVTGAVAYPFEKIAEGAEAVGGAVTDTTGSPLAGTAVNTAIQAAPMLIGKGAKAIPGESAASIAARARQQALNAPKAEAVNLAREVGLKLTPEEAGGGPVSRGVASIAGEPKLAKLLSKKNAPTINDMIRRDVGLPDDVPLSREALAQIRKEAGEKYEAVKSVGRFGTDEKYRADLKAVTKQFDDAKEDFAHRAESPIQKTIEGLDVKGMKASSAIAEVKNLRNDADKAYRAGDKQLGKAYRDAAEALDGMLERHLDRHARAVGDPEVAKAVAEYKGARQRIAKTYAADKALDDSTGNINAKVYAAARRKGVPLSGEAADVAKLAQAFERSTQRSAGAATGPTIFDAAIGLIFGEPIAGQSSIARGLAGLTARPLARSVMGSEPVQYMMTRPQGYGQPGLRTLQDIIREIGTEAGATGVAAGQ